MNNISVNVSIAFSVSIHTCRCIFFNILYKIEVFSNHFDKFEVRSHVLLRHIAER